MAYGRSPCAFLRAYFLVAGTPLLRQENVPLRYSLTPPGPSPNIGEGAKLPVVCATSRTNMQELLNQVDAAVGQIAVAADLEALDAVRVSWLGKSGVLTEQL